MGTTNSKTPSSATEPETPPYSISYPLFSASSETPISPASALPPPVWDVFISFHGKDTRYNFTSHLYQRLVEHGITTFMDDSELRTGEVISDALVEAIQKSKIYVVVLSENFASSSWCLNELVEISKCYQPTNRLVIGVYCNIQPTAVRYQTGSFQQAFKKHDARVAKMETVKEVAAQREKVKTWRRTLSNVAAFSGKPVSDTRSEADIINEIVDVVLLEIKPKTLPVAEHPVGLDSRVNDITEILNSCTKDGVIIIGLFGMGGVGKSTLAKAVYNQLLPDRSFKGCCYLAEVSREVSLKADGLVSLQQQLLDDVLKSKKKVEVHNVDEGTMFIKKRICSAKVLVLIDDIDDHEQYKSLVGPFAPGSVVIVTTRDENILEKIGVERKFRCKVKELDKTESRTLFIQHAFGHAKPDSRLTELFEEILSLADGLPLALKVFGGFLFTVSDEEGWKSYINELKRNPDNGIQEKLLISLKALKSRDKKLEKVFLDIACFFIGRKRQDVVDIMETYYPDVDRKIDALMKSCLLTIEDYSRTLKMHELLRNMGEEVARNNSPDEPGKHSRLWVWEDICNVLKNHRGTAAIEGIIPSNLYYHGVEGMSFAAATFKSMSILRFLYIKNVGLSGSFEQTFDNLRWLQWEGCPLEYLPSDFCPEKLVLLALRSSKMRTMWKPNTDPQVVFKNLKTLDMSNSLDLTKGPDFTKLPCLETLNLEGCKSLKEVHVSVGRLASLRSLNLRLCVDLRCLPDDICNLTALERLDIGGCSSLKALPIKLGNIESLTELNAWGLTTVSKIPDSIFHLSNLDELNLSDYEYGTPSPTSWDIPFPTTSWDVFLNFGGSDTRYGFSSQLYHALDRHGVRTFPDVPELERGENISSASIRAIRESKIYVVVFSKSYASSSWCLEELGEILNSHKTMERWIIPVYYDIHPSVVRHQEESFNAAFKMHESRYKGQMEKVNKWRRTLAEVADLAGWVVSDRSDEAGVISEVVKRVLNEISHIGLKNVAKYPVGLDSRLRELMNGFRFQYRIIGLYGMGGVGKSTLAGAVYSALMLRGFEGKCFLANVREIWRTPKGVVSLQQQLINDLLGTTKVQVHNVEEGSKMIRSIFRCLGRVLVVIDDLADHKQFESLVGPLRYDSKVIVTTRYEEILSEIKVEPKYIYKVNVLDYAESLELFTRHAFGNDIPDKKLLELSKDFVHHARGNPRTLVSWGAHLYKKSEVEWRDYIEKHIFSKDLTELYDLKGSIESDHRKEWDDLTDSIESDDQKDSIQLDDLKDSIESDHRKELDDSIESDDLTDSMESDDQKDSIQLDDLKDSIESDHRKELDGLADSIESDDPEESILSDNGKESDCPKESDDLVQKNTFLKNACLFLSVLFVFLLFFCFVR